MKKLTKSQWEDLKQDYLFNGYSVKELSKKYGITLAMIYGKGYRQGWIRRKVNKEGIIIRIIKFLFG